MMYKPVYTEPLETSNYSESFIKWDFLSTSQDVNNVCLGYKIICSDSCLLISYNLISELSDLANDQ